MSNKDYYESKIRPYAFDDTIKYSQLSLFQKFKVWIHRKSYT